MSSLPASMKRERMKNGREKVKTPFFPVITLSVTMETSGWIWPNFKLIQALMYVIITCKYEKDLIKNSREKVETSFFHYKPIGIFSDVQGQLTPQSVVQSSRNSNSSELSCMSSLPASMKRIRLKTAEKKWRHSFSHHNPLCYHGNQWLDLAKFQSHPSSHVCYQYLQV